MVQNLSSMTASATVDVLTNFCRNKSITTSWCEKADFADEHYVFTFSKVFWGFITKHVSTLCGILLDVSWTEIGCLWPVITRCISSSTKEQLRRWRRRSAGCTRQSRMRMDSCTSHTRRRRHSDDADLMMFTHDVTTFKSTVSTVLMWCLTHFCLMLWCLTLGFNYTNVGWCQVWHGHISW